MALGHPCKACGNSCHYCGNCGVEMWYRYYCSRECLEKDGKKSCFGCNGFGHDCERVEDKEDEYCNGYVEKI